eukprot:7880925-Lingulodinium_polyedra.AAC.1
MKLQTRAAGTALALPRAATELARAAGRPRGCHAPPHNYHGSAMELTWGLELPRATRNLPWRCHG